MFVCLFVCLFVCWVWFVCLFVWFGLVWFGLVCLFVCLFVFVFVFVFALACACVSVCVCVCALRRRHSLCRRREGQPGQTEATRVLRTLAANASNGRATGPWPLCKSSFAVKVLPVVQAWGCVRGPSVFCDFLHRCEPAEREVALRA